MIRVHVINLARSPERRAFMREQLGREHVEPLFFDATDAARGDLAGVSRYDHTLALQRFGHALQSAEVGCFASHYRLWQHCAAGREPCVIMEDDVRVFDGFRTALEHADALIGQLHFLRLSAMKARPMRELRALDGTYRLVRYLKGPYGLQCYALSPQGARRLLDGADVWIDAVDAYVDSFWRHGLAPFALLPFRAMSDEGMAQASTIGNGRFQRERDAAHQLRRKFTRTLDRLRRTAFNLRYRDLQ